ncbi:hypothetical protein [Chryseobacterium gossypii]|uniref:hypothetical protein n=1 Tax=Chryseobacterium gossypii TaxID=3231602 RepID=UPI0035247231
MNRTATSKPQIFLLSYAGGDRSFFRPLTGGLQSHFQAETTEFPGRGDRVSDPPLKNKQKVVAGVLKTDSICQLNDTKLYNS